MVRKTEKELLEEIQEKRRKNRLKDEQLKARELQLKARLNEKERKARTRLLIQYGAIFEKWFELTSIKEAEEVGQAFHQMVKAHLKKGGIRNGKDTAFSDEPPAAK
ncbi:MAG: hypothetical protein ACK4UN_01335 [Limisphaerales bacterium]